MTVLDEELAAFAQLTVALRQPFYQWWVAVFQAMRALLEGRFGEAEHLAHRAAVLGQRVQDHTSVQSVLFTQLWIIYQEQGRVQELQALQPGGTYFATQYATAPGWQVTPAFLASVLGQEAEARREFEVLAADDFVGLGWDASWLEWDHDALSGLRLPRRCAPGGHPLYPPAPLCRAERGERQESQGVLRPGLLLPGAPGDAARPVGRGRAAFQRRAGAERQDGGTALGGAHPTRLRLHAAGPSPPGRPGEGAGTPRTGACHRAGPRDDRPPGAGPPSPVSSPRGSIPPPGASRQPPPASPQDATRRTQDAPAHVASLEAPGVQNIFRHEGAYWTLAYQGQLCRLKEAKGLHYLATLLRSPGREFHVADLAALTPPTRALWGAPSPTLRPEALAAQHLRVTGPGDAGAQLDARARAAYTQRLEDLQAVLDEAERFNDPERAATARAEIDFLTTQLATAYGLGRRPAKARIPMRRCARP